MAKANTDQPRDRCDLTSYLILLALSLLALPFHHAWASTEKLEQDFAERFDSLVVDNPGGPTEVRSWNENRVRVVASRRDGAVSSSELSFERERDRLRIVVNPKDERSPLGVAVYLPASTTVAIRSAAGEVSASGPFAGLSIVTDSGSVTIALADSSHAALSLRTLEGTIQQRIPVTIFGKTDSHMLDGETGFGGPPVIVRSTRGNITVVAAAQTQTASTAGTDSSFDRKREVTRSAGEASGRISPAEAKSFTAGIRINDEAIRLEGRLVNLNVKVTDAGGKTLPALKKEDFAVYEDGVPQDVTFFEPITAPLHLVLLLDLSGSTEKKMKVMKKAAQKFVDSLRSTDTVAVAGFTRRFFIISNFTTNHKLLKDRIDDIKNRHSGTAYYDAMWSTLDLFEEVSTTRKAIVVLTDGVDNSLSNPDESELAAKHGFEELFARTEEADITIYPIYIDTEYETIGRRGSRGHDAYVTARRQLEALADQTGAMMFKAERAEDLDGVYQQVAAELHSLYSMAYAPKVVRKDGKWAKISVAVNLPGARIRTKRGYYAK